MHLIETMRVVILFLITPDTAWFSDTTVLGQWSAVNLVFRSDLQEGHRLCREAPTQYPACKKGSREDVINSSSLKKVIQQILVVCFLRPDSARNGTALSFQCSTMNWLSTCSWNTYLDFCTVWVNSTLDKMALTLHWAQYGSQFFTPLPYATIMLPTTTLSWTRLDHVTFFGHGNLNGIMQQQRLQMRPSDWLASCTPVIHHEESMPQ